MRWRIAIAVLAVLGIVGAVYIGTQPKKGNVHYHRQQLAAYRKQGKIELWLGGWFPGCAQLLQNRRYRLTVHHRNALFELGFLERRTLIVSNQSPHQIWQQIVRVILTNDFGFQEGYGGWDFDGNTVTFISKSTDADHMERLIRQADVPENK